MEYDNFLTNQLVDQVINLAFKEDIDQGDITSESVVSESAQAKAEWTAKDDGILAGLSVAKKVFSRLDENLEWNPKFSDGDSISKGDILVKFNGSCRSLLTGERIALNFVQRMSGIATKTNHIVKKLESQNTKILDTRKTAPGLRVLDKYAVAAGGGTNHRMGLFDMAMIKDNHIIAAGSIQKAVDKVRQNNPGVKIEVETTTLSQVEEALEAGADIIMLDNMDIEMMKNAVERIGKQAQTEASGNITEKNITDVAGTGVNFISIGALTHSVKAFDISQSVQEIR